MTTSIITAISPPKVFNIFNYTPRSPFALGLVFCFLARWRGQFLASYLLLFCLSFIHNSNALIAMIVLIGLQVIFQPKSLKDPKSLFAAIFCFIFILWRENIFKVLNLQSILLFLMCIAILLGLVVALYKNINAIQRLHSRLYDFLDRLPMESKDIFVISIGWFMTLPIAKWISLQSDFYTNRHLWWQFHSRISSMFILIILVGAALFLIKRYGPRFPGYWKLIPSFAAVLIILVSFSQIDNKGLQLRLGKSFAHLDKQENLYESDPSSFAFNNANEVVWYAMMVKSLYNVKEFPILCNESSNAKK